MPCSSRVLIHTPWAAGPPDLSKRLRRPPKHSGILRSLWDFALLSLTEPSLLDLNQKTDEKDSSQSSTPGHPEKSILIHGISGGILWGLCYISSFPGDTRTTVI